MTEPDEYSFQRYLEAKRTVDDRALHRPTIDRLRSELASVKSTGPIRVLDVGAGTGAMFRRLIDWEVIPEGVHYTGIDTRDRAVTTGREQIREWAVDHGWNINGDGTAERPANIQDGERSFRAALRQGDVFEIIDDGNWDPDLIVGCAFLDVVELDQTLPRLFETSSEALAYFPITFDGETIFQPVHDASLNSRMMDAFHATMNEPDRPGGSTTGRQLFDAIPSHGGTILSAGGSDWVISPTQNGYPADEEYFLHHIVDIVTGAVRDHQPAAIDPGEIEEWGNYRHAEVNNAELFYSAHQFDVLAEV